MRSGSFAAACGCAIVGWTSAARAQLAPHETASGEELQNVTLHEAGDPLTAWKDLSTRPVLPDRYPTTLLFTVPAGIDAVEIPPCANLTELAIDFTAVRAAPLHPRVIELTKGREHDVRLRIRPTDYEARVACGYPPRMGARSTTLEGLDEFSFLSVHAGEGGGKALVYVPRAHDRTRPSALLVGLHPWNGGIWTYAAYAELLHEADVKDVVLLMPSGLGNSLYTEHAEDEVLTAIAELSHTVAIDARRVSIWGASMGGAGATTIGFHHPDRFATITSFFGDSRYDLKTYVSAILHDEAGAHRVNALDVAENARNVPVWLIHGEADKVSPIAQSEMLADRLDKLGFHVRFDRVPGMGHEGMLVAKFIAQVVDRASASRIPDAPLRVSFTSTSPYDASAYGIRLIRGGARGDASIDVEYRDDTVHVLRARGVRRVLLPRGAFGTPPARAVPIVIDDARARRVEVVWDALPSAI